MGAERRLHSRIMSGVVVDGVLLTDANSTWCERSGSNLDDGWNSNHCAIENNIWIVAQTFLFLAYMFGWLSTLYNIRRYRYVGVMRLGILFYAILMMAWCDNISYAKDQLAYAAITFVVCLLHLFYIFCVERPITLNDYLHNLWHKMFNMNGYNLELLDFYNLMQEKAFLKTYHRESGHVYINEGDIPSQLSILLSGKMAIWKRDDWQRKDLFMAHHTTEWERKRQEQPNLPDSEASSQYAKNHEYAFCGNVYPYEFIDSYEWLMGQGVSKFDGSAQPNAGTS